MPFEKTVDQVAQEINDLYAVYGKETYEEKCTQLQHAQQAGTLALEKYDDRELALAAFLHDIGHFLAQRADAEAFDAYGYACHDTLGADFLLTHGFSQRIVELVREHVQVKRYLAATQEGYLNALSHASSRTLQQQRGPMSEEEVKAYQTKTNLEDIVVLRQLDDCGKLPHMEVKDLCFWVALIKQTLPECRNTQAA